MKVYKYLEKKKIQSRPVICGNMANQPFCINKFINKEKLKNAFAPIKELEELIKDKFQLTQFS